MNSMTLVCAICRAPAPIPFAADDARLGTRDSSERSGPAHRGAALAGRTGWQPLSIQSITSVRRHRISEPSLTGLGIRPLSASRRTVRTEHPHNSATDAASSSSATVSGADFVESSIFESPLPGAMRPRRARPIPIAESCAKEDAVCAPEVRVGRLAAHGVQNGASLSLSGSRRKVGFYLPTWRLRRALALPVSISAGSGSGKPASAVVGRPCFNRSTYVSQSTRCTLRRWGCGTPDALLGGRVQRTRFVGKSSRTLVISLIVVRARSSQYFARMVATGT